MPYIVVTSAPMLQLARATNASKVFKLAISKHNEA